MSAEDHIPTPKADPWLGYIVCLCEWESRRHGSLAEAWKEYRQHWTNAVDSADPLKIPRRPANAPVQTERLFIP